jgi:hypothetical protein
VKEIVEYFDRAYIINLSDRTDRRRQVMREFGRIGIKIPNEKILFYTAVRPTDKGKFEDIGTRGCFNSHRTILEVANRDHLRNVLVFEDDVCFRQLGREFGQNLIAQLSREAWDLMFFGYNLPCDDTLTGPLLRWPNDVLGTHFYAVNGCFIAAMLQYMNACELRPSDHPDGGPMPADGVYNHVRYVTPNVKMFLSVPNLAYQRSSRTDIASASSIDRVMWLRPIVHGARAVKHQIRMSLDKNKLRHRKPNTTISR